MPKEKEIQKVIIEYLSLKKYLFYRQNSGAFRTEKGFYRFASLSGIPDIVVILPPNGRYVGIECKSSSGQLNPNQKVFKEQLEAMGGTYIVARTLEDVINEL